MYRIAQPELSFQCSELVPERQPADAFIQRAMIGGQVLSRLDNTRRRKPVAGRILRVLPGL